MPQMNKGGKFIFGRSIIGADGRIQFPTQAILEYHITSERRIYLFTGSKSTGGFCVTRKGLLLPSKLGHILTEQHQLLNYTVPLGKFVWYKGRAYCWKSSPECRSCPFVAVTSHLQWEQRGLCSKKRKTLRALYQSFDGTSWNDWHEQNDIPSI